MTAPEIRNVPRTKLWGGVIVLECVCGTAVPYPGHPDEADPVTCDTCGRIYQAVPPEQVVAG